MDAGKPCVHLHLARYVQKSFKKGVNPRNRNSTNSILVIVRKYGCNPKVKDRLKALLYTRLVVATFVSEVDWYSNPISLKCRFKKFNIQYQFLRKSNKIQYQSTFFLSNFF